MGQSILVHLSYMTIMRFFGLVTFAMLVVGVTSQGGSGRATRDRKALCKKLWEREVWDTRADPPTYGTCGGRVNWLIENVNGYTLRTAIATVGSESFAPDCTDCKYCWELTRGLQPMSGTPCSNWIHKDGRGIYVFQN